MNQTMPQSGTGYARLYDSYISIHFSGPSQYYVYLQQQGFNMFPLPKDDTHNNPIPFNRKSKRQS